MRINQKILIKTVTKTFFMMFYAILLLFVTSCKKDIFQPEAIANDDNRGVEFVVQLPGLTNVITTYSITDLEENALQTIDILAFKVNNKGTVNETETFGYKVEGTNLTTPATSTPANKSFRAHLQKDSKVYYRFVVLANVRTKLNSISIAANESKASVLEKMVIEKTGQWNAASSSNYDAFPMWGETEQQIVNDNTTQISSIKLLRSLARIDVFLSGTAWSNFVITSINVINSRSTGLLAPSNANYNATTGTVTAESVLSPANFNTGALTYTVPSPGRSFQQQIYVFESTKSSLAGSQTASTELIIAGRYNGSSTITYYKVAFLDASGNALPLLRNFKYSVNINKVGGAGYTTSDLALRNIPVNMEVVTVPWDDSGMNIMATDGQYILALSSDKIEIGGALGQTTAFTVYTDYPEGWYAKSLQNWLSVSTVKSGNRYIVTVTAQVISNVGASGPRIGSIFLSTGNENETGRITRTITVTQRNTR